MNPAHAPAAIWKTLACAAILAGCGGGSLGGASGDAGGTTGAAGTTVTGGGGIPFGGSNGLGGSDPNPPNPCPGGPPTSCGPAACGNGVRDTCQVPSGPGACPTYTFTEVCDGTDVGNDTCQAHGFAGGALRCYPGCTFVDTSTCTECPATSARVLRCGAAPVQNASASMALAANDNEVALAWIVANDPQHPATLAFARLDASLNVISTSYINDPALQAPYSSGVLAMAPTASGWVVAVFAGPELFVRAIDANGRDLGRTTVDSIPEEDGFNSLTIAPRPNGGALLLWLTGKGAREAVISDDGASTTTPRDLQWPSPDIFFVSAAYVGDAFYLSFSAPIDDAHGQLYFQRIAVDGTPAAPLAVVADPSAGAPQLASGANELRIVYSTYKAGTAPNGRYDVGWQRFDASGQTLASATPLSAIPYLAASALAFGDDTVALLEGYNATAVAITRIDPTGNVVTPVFEIASWTQPALVSMVMAKRGPEAVVAWIGLSDGIRIARVQP